jgi:hypothetical protein
MAAISTCPKCGRQVAIPAGLDFAAVVRCPICNAEYALYDAIATAPPPLIPVGPSAKGESPFSSPPADERSLAEMWAMTDRDRGVAAPEGRQKKSEATRRTKTESEDADEYPLETDHVAAEPEPEADAEPFSVDPVTPRRLPPQKSGSRTVLGIAISGIFGILAAYYLLAWWLGPRFNELYLPYLPLPGIEQLTADQATPNFQKPNSSGVGTAPSRRP